jgi:two-component system chemotaxis sensor kinase CheA
VTKPPDDLLNIFWVEAAEYLEALNQILLQLEVAAPEDNTTDQLREVSRIAHSLKGASRAVGQTTIEQLSHKMEDVFDLTLDGSLLLNPAICDALYDSLDLVQMYADGSEPEPETIEVVLKQLEGLVTQGREQSTNGTGTESNSPTDTSEARQQMLIPAVNLPVEARLEPPATLPAVPDSGATQRISRTTLTSTTTLRATEDTVRVSLSKLDQLMGQASELLIARMHSEQRRTDLQALIQEHRRWQRIWRQVRSAYIRTTRRLKDTRELSTGGEGSTDLINLLDFLDVTQHYMTQASRQLVELNRALAQDNLHLTTLVDGLQADIASVRMLPFETILGGFQRMVRDLGRESGKQVTLLVEGADVELDKHVLEMLKDPLMHILRNSVDHGIETPEERVAANKSPSGTITLTIASRGNDIHVSIDDDGSGIDPEIVRHRALNAGLIGDVDIDVLTTAEITSLIFEPGFSTAEAVTAVSGRGVGLDVVRQRVEALRGRLWLDNSPGLGATFHLIVPVSLTRIRCLLARVGTENFAIPLTTVTRIINIQPEEVFHVEDRPMIEVDGRPMPLVHLAEVLELPDAPSTLTANSPILILHSTEQRNVAFIIDDLVSEQELVLKKLGDELSRVRNVAGAAILGTGDVVIVLQTSDLIKSARRARGILTGPPEELPETTEEAERPYWILVVDDSLTTRTLEKNILEAAGYRVRTATDGTEALKTLLEQPFDVIVADVEMPNMNGFELAKRVKGDARWRETPFILVTSLDSPSDRERGMRAGADAYLVKTRFDQDELLYVIQQMV